MKISKQQLQKEKLQLKQKNKKKLLLGDKSSSHHSKISWIDDDLSLDGSNESWDSDLNDDVRELSIDEQYQLPHGIVMEAAMNRSRILLHNANYDIEEDKKTNKEKKEIDDEEEDDLEEKEVDEVVDDDTNNNVQSVSEIKIQEQPQQEQPTGKNDEKSKETKKEKKEKKLKKQQEKNEKKKKKNGSITSSSSGCSSSINSSSNSSSISDGGSNEKAAVDMHHQPSRKTKAKTQAVTKNMLDTSIVNKKQVKKEMTIIEKIRHRPEILAKNKDKIDTLRHTWHDKICLIQQRKSELLQQSSLTSTELSSLSSSSTHSVPDSSTSTKKKKKQTTQQVNSITATTNRKINGSNIKSKVKIDDDDGVYMTIHGIPIITTE